MLSKVLLLGLLLCVFYLQYTQAQVLLTANVPSSSFDLTSDKYFYISVPKNVEATVWLQSISFSFVNADVYVSSAFSYAAYDFSVPLESYPVPVPFASNTDATTSTWYLRASCASFYTCTSGSLFTLTVDYYTPNATNLIPISAQSTAISVTNNRFYYGKVVAPAGKRVKMTITSTGSWQMHYALNSPPNRFSKNTYTSMNYAFLSQTTDVYFDNFLGTTSDVYFALRNRGLSTSITVSYTLEVTDIPRIAIDLIGLIVGIAVASVAACVLCICGIIIVIVVVVVGVLGCTGALGGAAIAAIANPRNKNVQAQMMDIPMTPVMNTV